MPGLNRLSGVLLVDKPVGYSSRYVTNAIMKAFNIRKVGHAGTLDKMASGMLPICLGQATKYVSFLSDSDKSYTLKALFGYSSTTGDMEGDCKQQKDMYFTYTDLETAIKKFQGQIQQIPPMYSALKHNGQPLYKIARSGQQVVRKPRTVTISKIIINDFSWPWVSMQVICSKGTYIRTLVEDIALELNTCAYILELRRDWVAGFEKFNMHDISLVRTGSKDLLLPVEAALVNMSELTLDEIQAEKLLFGQQVFIENYPDGRYKITNNGQFIGVGVVLDNYLKAQRLMASRLN